MLFELQAQVQWVVALGIIFAVTRLSGVLKVSWLWIFTIPLILLGQVGILLFFFVCLAGGVFFLFERLD